MKESELKWAISGTLLMILALSLGLNSAIFQSNNQQQADNSKIENRGIASVAPVINISWEKRAFEILKDADQRDVASVGIDPSPFDRLSFGVLEGKYAIQLAEGKISQIHFADNGNDTDAKIISNRQEFLQEYQGLIANKASQVRSTFAESNGELTVEKYELASNEGQVVATVEMRMDSQERLISLIVQ